MLKRPKQPQKVHPSFSKTRDDIEMKQAKHREATSKAPIRINKTQNQLLINHQPAKTMDLTRASTTQHPTEEYPSHLRI